MSVLAKKRDIKIGILGLGSWGRNILRNLYELDVLHTACDSNPQVIKERKKKFPGINYTLHPEDVFKDPQINAVIISTSGNYALSFSKGGIEAK